MKKFLIVEDDKSMRSLYTLLLTRYFENSSVSFSYNGDEALQEILDTDFDLIISDINMEVMDGVTFHLKLKEIDPLLADRVIFMSSSNTGPHINYIKDAGLTFLQKPFSVSDFYSLLSSINYLKTRDGLGARRYKRTDFIENCIIETFFNDNPLDGQKIKGQSIDYSAGGMGIKYSGEAFISGESIHIFSEALNISNREAKVVWTSAIDDGNYRMGLQWT